MNLFDCFEHHSILVDSVETTEWTYLGINSNITELDGSRETAEAATDDHNFINKEFGGERGSHGAGDRREAMELARRVEEIEGRVHRKEKLNIDM